MRVHPWSSDQLVTANRTTPVSGTRAKTLGFEKALL